MLKVTSFDQIQGFVRDIRAQRSGYVTNFYWDPQKHPYWIAESALAFDRSEHCILMWHPSDRFVSIFYIATSLEAVAERLQVLPKGSPWIADVVCKGDGIVEQEAFKAMGFETYQHLYRMMHAGRMIGDDWTPDARVQIGSDDDAVLVWDIFQRDFDPLAEQLPSLKEIRDFAARKELLVIKTNERIAGFLIYQMAGSTWYLRYWYTSPVCRNQGIGAGLLKTALLEGADSKRQIFWVIADNENAIKRYEHYGFRREDMNDYVMIKR
jgi:ribosomal protein S18 acetylase RimI-like enzyme